MKRHIGWSVGLTLAAAVAVLGTGCPKPPEECSNGSDDDEDGAIDCADSDCTTDPSCTGGVEDCSNSIDDDGDSYVDCADSSCVADPACAGMVETDCANGIDDDGDGDTDCADSSCLTDPACAGMVETNCGNGMDDDGDGDTDCADTDCSTDPACTAGPVCGNGTTEPPETCDDGNTTSGDGCSSTCMNEAMCIPDGGACNRAGTPPCCAPLFCCGTMCCAG